MRISSVAAFGLWLLTSPLATACQDDHDDGKVWTKEELEELENKWGFEVNIHLHQNA
jgi:hypothetical protein